VLRAAAEVGTAEAEVGTAEAEVGTAEAEVGTAEAEVGTAEVRVAGAEVLLWAQVELLLWARAEIWAAVARLFVAPPAWSVLARLVLAQFVLPGSALLDFLGCRSEYVTPGGPGLRSQALTHSNLWPRSIHLRGARSSPGSPRFSQGYPCFSPG
jgi:hypothetical protein